MQPKFVNCVGVNNFIKCELKNVDLVFDCVKYLAKNDSEPHMAKYGGHPDYHKKPAQHRRRGLLCGG